MRIPHARVSLVVASLVLALGTAVAGHQDPKPTPTPMPKPIAVVGDEAPLFTLNDHEGNLVSVGGKSETWTVIALYPKALTGG